MVLINELIAGQVSEKCSNLSELIHRQSVVELKDTVCS